MKTPPTQTSYTHNYRMFFAGTVVMRPFKRFFQTPTLKWKRFDVWYSAVSRIFSMAFPNTGAEGKFFSEAVNPNMRRRKRFS